jgi:site-specific DNA-methyltransferase (adenine-specific)
MIDLKKGDCLELMRVIPDKSIDAIICDLPYGTTANKWDSIIPMDVLWCEYERIIKPKGNIILFGTGLFAFKLALSNEKLFRYDMIWEKSKSGSPFTAKYMPLKKHEIILVFGESASKYNPQMTTGKPYKRKWTPNKLNNMKYGIKGVQTDNKGTRHPITILKHAQKWRRQDQVHPTQKPTSLMEFLVNSFTDKNDTVLDNTMGSGTTGVACVNLNRNFIGMELDDKYFDIATTRIYEAQHNLFTNL